LILGTHTCFMVRGGFKCFGLFWYVSPLDALKCS
jgi:hypothetical protein